MSFPIRSLPPTGFASILWRCARIPTMHSLREYVEVGGLISYGPNVSDMFRRAGELVDKILRGAKPADIPVEQPRKFDLTINLTTPSVFGAFKRAKRAATRPIP